MNITSILILSTALFVRLGVPVLLTALVVFVLRKLDIRWQAEAARERNALLGDEMPCWREQALSLGEIKLRVAKGGKPCWQTHRLSNGYLWEDCLECEVFLGAPIPTHKPSHVHS